MRIVEFDKITNVGVLHKELAAAGFKVLGVSCDFGRGRTMVELEDTEVKSPAVVVAAHVYREPKEIDWRAEFARAGTNAEKLAVIGKYMGFVDMTDDEIYGGVLRQA